MIVLKILAAPFVVALTLLVAIVSFLYCVASAVCHIGCVVLTLLALVLFIGGQTLGGAWCSLYWRSSFRPLASRPSLTGSWTGSTR